MNIQKWSRLSLAQQLGHVGSELARARHWEDQKDLTSRDKALERALELIDLTLEDKRWRTRLKEIARLREMVCDWLLKQNHYETRLTVLEQYCTEFMLASK